MSPIDEQMWWYAARAGGIVAMILVAASVLWGLLLSSKYLAGGPKPKGLLDVHKFLGAMSVVFTVVHMVALYLDAYVEFTLTHLLVPFASTWRPAEVAAGVVAFWLLIGVQVTSMMMRRLPRKLWKWIHLASYLLLPLGLLHGITAGTDAETAWYRLGSATLIGLLVWLTVWRAWMVPARRRVPRDRPDRPVNAAVGAGRS